MIKKALKIQSNKTYSAPWRGKNKQTFPDIILWDFKSYADYMLKSDGMISDSDFMLAGDDIKWFGNPTQIIESIIAIIELIDISENRSILGLIIAKGATTISGFVSVGNSISGNPTIIDKGTTSTPFSTGTKTVSFVS